MMLVNDSQEQPKKLATDEARLLATFAAMSATGRRYLLGIAREVQQDFPRANDRSHLSLVAGGV